MIAKIDELVKLENAVIQPLDLPIVQSNKISADVLRLDKIHATISGNKWFKLKYSLQDALKRNSKSVITFGGAYSNHLVATAYACHALGIKSIGIIRGEPSSQLSCSLRLANEYGMELVFQSRSAFKNRQQLYEETRNRFPEGFIIEEGGMNKSGTRGCAEILQLLKSNHYRYICCAIGTGTTIAGLMMAGNQGQKFIGISSLKIPVSENSIESFIETSMGKEGKHKIFYDYHFGGYAKCPSELIGFMNELYRQTLLPTDFVYTGKMFFGVIDLIKKSFFEPGSSLLCIHSGGLQGNCSLTPGTLLF